MSARQKGKASQGVWAVACWLNARSALARDAFMQTKIAFFIFPCYFPFEIFGRCQIFHFYLYDLIPISSEKIFKIWFPKQNITLNLVQVSEKFIKFIDDKNMIDYTEYYWFFIWSFQIFRFHLDIKTSIGSKKIFKMWFPKLNWALNPMLWSEKLRKSTEIQYYLLYISKHSYNYRNLILLLHILYDTYFW